MKLKFPHIPRFISAGVLWAGILALVAFNFPLRKSGPEALVSPKQAAVHEKQAHVLGAQTTRQIQYWLGVAAAHPDYRDAYVQLASLSYAQGNLTQTKMYIKKAAELDPNGKAVSRLLEFITKL